MPKARLLNGKPLIVNGKVAMSEDCCCGSTPPPACPLPEGSCVEAICFELFLDDTDTTDQDFIDLAGPGVGLGIWFDGTAWQLYSVDSVSLVAINPRNTWQTFQIQLSKQLDGSVTGEWTVNGVSGPSFTFVPSAATSAIITSIQFGAQFAGTGGGKHRSIRNVALASDVAGFDFSFPPDSFDSLVGSGTSIDGSGNLRIDSDIAAEDDYGNKAAISDAICCSCTPSPGWRDCTEIFGFDLTYSFRAHSDLSGPGPCIPPDCCPEFDSSGSHTFHFTRVNRADLVDDGSLTFALYTQKVDGTCLLLGQSFHFAPVGIRYDFPISGGVCNLILDTISLGGTGADECGGSAAEFTFGAGGVTSNYCECTDDNVNFTPCTSCIGEGCEDGFIASRCGAVDCGIGTSVDLGPWTGGNVDGIRGTYTAENTCTPDADRSMTVTATLVIS